MAGSSPAARCRATYSAPGRAPPQEKEANNEIRTALLKALGNAFGLAGVSESDGKVKFSAAFMNRLERILGRDVFKKSDFGVKGPDGAVTSGRPLTQRRIRAILTKAAEVGNTPLTRDSIAVYETRLATIAKKINLDAYEAKLKETASLDEVQKLEAEADLINKFPLQAHFHVVKNALAFYKNELPNFLRKNDYFDENALKDDADESDYTEYETQQYQMYDADKNQYVNYNRLDRVSEYLHRRCGLIMHTENAAPGMIFSKMQDPVKDMTACVGNAFSQFIEVSINGYIAADKVGRAMDFFHSAISACIEGKCDDMLNFLSKNNLMPQVEGEENFSATEILDAADSAHDETTPLDNCIYTELNTIAKKAKAAGKNTDGWKWEDVAESVKKALVGKKRPIMVPGQSLTGLVNLTEGGKKVVREVTAADLDNIGQKCMDSLMIF